MQKPKTIKAKTLWNGQVAIRDKYLAELDGKRDLVFLLMDGKGEQMTIPKEDIRRRGKLGKEVFRDRFSAATHRLVYYDWKPDKNPQTTLL